jgi:hypothetical protein
MYKGVHPPTVPLMMVEQQTTNVAVVVVRRKARMNCLAHRDFHDFIQPLPIRGGDLTILAAGRSVAPHAILDAAVN